MEVKGNRVTVHDDRLHTEVDRQLVEVRTACDGLASRSGLLIAATGVGAAIIASRIKAGNHEILLVLAFVAISVSTLCAVSVLVPWLKVGPAATSLSSWMSGKSSPKTSSLLYESKMTILTSNTNRWLVMRVLFTIQAISTILAVALALGYSALK
jgi:hypothetical protein